MTDEEYLEKAGIKDEVASTPSQEETSNVSAESAPASKETAPTTAAEMFELSGNRYPVTSEFKITHGGKILNVPYSTLANTYRQAAHMQDKWAAFKKDQESFQSRLQEYDRYKGFYDKYNPIQEWSEKNPDQWNRLWDLFQNKDHLLGQTQGMQPGAQGSPNQAAIQQWLDHQLKEKLAPYEKYVKENETRAQQEAEAKDIELVKGQIVEFQNKFKEIDLQERDPDNLPLWARIVQWGHVNGYKDFNSAARQYLDERIQDVIRLRERDSLMKAQKQDKQNGIVKRSATPMNFGQGQTASKPENVRNKSWSDLAEEAKAELRGMTGT